LDVEPSQRLLLEARRPLEQLLEPGGGELPATEPGEAQGQERGHAVRLADRRTGLRPGAPQGEREVELLHRTRGGGGFLGGERLRPRAEDRAVPGAEPTRVLRAVVPQLLEQSARLRSTMRTDAGDVLAGRGAATAPTRSRQGQGAGRLCARWREEQ